MKKSTVPPMLTDVVSISAGYEHSVALKKDGTVVAWGSDNYRYLQCTIPQSAVDIISICAGPYHTLALRNDGTVVAWGDNLDGECVVPEDLNNVVSIAAGDGQSLAVKEDGSVVQWGGEGYLHEIPEGLKVAHPKSSRLSISSLPPISYCAAPCALDEISTDRELENALRGTVIEITFGENSKKTFLLAKDSAKMQNIDERAFEEFPSTPWTVMDSHLRFTTEYEFGGYDWKMNYSIDLNTLRGEAVASNVDRMYRHEISMAANIIRPDLESCIRCYVRRELEQWQAKGEFEKTADYLERVTEQSRNEAIQRFQAEAISVIENQIEQQLRLTGQLATLNPYDADNETFKIDCHWMGPIFLNVPIDEAPYFKDHLCQVMEMEKAFILGR